MKIFYNITRMRTYSGLGFSWDYRLWDALEMKEGIIMKYNNSRLSLKQRWLSFALCILIALLAGIFALYSYIEAYPFWTSACSLLVCAIMLFIAIFLLRLNMRRKRIQREFVSEFDKEIRKKEHMCPHCGALMGSGNTCAKCGYKGH